MRIKEKRNSRNGKPDILLMGHSIFDNWDVQYIDKYKVYNYGISGITAEDYYCKIIKKNYLINVPNICFLMLGINDIKYAVEHEKFLNYLQKIIDYLKLKNSYTKVYISEIANVNENIYINNDDVNKVNDYLRINIKNINGFVTMEAFNNEYGKLSLEYTSDGVHLNNKGYVLLNKLFCQSLQ